MNSHEQIERLRSQLTEHTTSFVLLYQTSEDFEGEVAYGGNYLACQELVSSASDAFMGQVMADCEDELDCEDEDEDGNDGDILVRI